MTLKRPHGIGHKPMTFGKTGLPQLSDCEKIWRRVKTFVGSLIKSTHPFNRQAIFRHQRRQQLERVDLFLQ